MKLFKLYVESSSAGRSLKWALPFPEPPDGTCHGQHLHSQWLSHAVSVPAMSQEDGDTAAAHCEAGRTDVAFCVSLHKCRVDGLRLSRVSKIILLYLFALRVSGRASRERWGNKFTRRSGMLFGMGMNFTLKQAFL